MIVVGIILFLSLIINGLLIWYSFRATKQLLFYSDSVTELNERLKEFDDHINFIYELEMFYGDETIKNLIRHSRDLSRYLKNYAAIESLVKEELKENMEEENNEFDDDFDDEEKDNSEESSANKTTRAGKTVFYSGA